ncbi:DNA topology modulation protein FlaR [Oceanobacillus sp. 1P07AA]|uniref:DNA topology modulation protein FlaR n=1 Tax=Oceanobacillus sp. 1P07AA TaxID=3132293 RepID=UPI0039A66A27
MCKVHIIGSVGSGKTTLARALKTILDIPHIELDNIVWIRDSRGDIRRGFKDRDALLFSHVQQNHWIIEGVHISWVDPSLEDADIIIFLDIPYRTRIYRIIRRFILQKLGKEPANYKPTISMFFHMIRWNRDFEKKSRRTIFAKLQPYHEKVHILQSSKDVEYFLLHFKSANEKIL